MGPMITLHIIIIIIRDTVSMADMAAMDMVRMVMRKRVKQSKKKRLTRIKNDFEDIIVNNHLFRYPQRNLVSINL